MPAPTPTGAGTPANGAANGPPAPTGPTTPIPPTRARVVDDRWPALPDDRDLWLTPPPGPTDATQLRRLDAEQRGRS